jgi:hypothetical protein
MYFLLEIHPQLNDTIGLPSGTTDDDRLRRPELQTNGKPHFLLYIWCLRFKNQFSFAQGTQPPLHGKEAILCANNNEGPPQLPAPL